METKRHAPLHLPMIIPALLIALLSLIPLGFIVWIAVTSGWDVVQQLVFRPKVAELLANTLVLVALTLVPASPSVRRGRMGDVVETMTLLALLPLMVLAAGFVSAVAG